MEGEDEEEDEEEEDDGSSVSQILRETVSKIRKAKKSPVASRKGLVGVTKRAKKTGPNIATVVAAAKADLKKGASAAAKKKMEVKDSSEDADGTNSPEIKLTNSTVRDFSQHGPNLVKDKFLLGDRISLQIGTVMNVMSISFFFRDLIIFVTGEISERSCRIWI